MSTQNQHLNVFVSSTVLDLIDYRKAAFDAIWRCGMFPLMMESSSARPNTGLEYSMDLTNQADIYVGIFASRYGDPPDGHEISITEMEYRRAVERGIPILVFLASDTSAMNGDGAERVEDPRLTRLKLEIQKNCVTTTFTTAEDLSLLVFQALTELTAQGRIVIGRAAKLHLDTVEEIPSAPSPYLAHPYIPQSSFVGRTGELAMLTEWMDSKDTVLVLESIGGAGKSALAWHWMRQVIESAPTRFAGVIWWSFYESNATVSNLLRHSLAYLGHETLEQVDRMRFRERREALAQYMRQSSILLVLDGLERILMAYRGSDAARLRDDEVGNDDKQARLNPRACLTKADQDFLYYLTTYTPSKILITSRLLPLDLCKVNTGQLLPGVRNYQLGGLSPHDAVLMMEERGIKGERDQVRRFLEQFACHPLLVDVLSGQIRNYRPAPGDFGEWYQHEGSHLRLSKISLAQRRTNILKYALNGLTPDLHLLLSQIAAFRYPVDYKALSVLNPYVPKMTEPTRPTQTDPDYSAAMHQYEQLMQEYRQAYIVGQTRFHQALSELEDRGLLNWERTADRYDLHPIVRSYAFEQLEDATRNRTFNQIRDHFESIPPERLEAVKDVSDLRRTIEIYYALLGGDLFDQAAQFYNNRLAEVLEHQLAAFDTVEELLIPLFKDGLDAAPRVSERWLQSNLIDRMANSFTNRGEVEQALQLRQVELARDVAFGSGENLTIVLINLVVDLQGAGRLAYAERAATLAFELAQAKGSQTTSAVAQLRYLELYSAMTLFDKAEEAYRNFASAPPTRQGAYWEADARAAHARLLLRQGKAQAMNLKAVEEAAQSAKNPLAAREALDLRAELAVSRHRYDEAARLWQQAIENAERAHGPISYYLAKLALVSIRENDPKNARRLIQDALSNSMSPEEASRTCAAVAVAFWSLSDYAEAQSVADQCYRVAWADGPPYSWGQELDTARDILVKLKAPLPDLPYRRPLDDEPTLWEKEVRIRIQEALEVRKRLNVGRYERVAPPMYLDLDPPLSEEKKGWWLFKKRK